VRVHLLNSNRPGRQSRRIALAMRFAEPKSPIR
jgi:hypothetical protein